MENDWKDQLCTPALVIDYEKMVKNMKTMSNFAKENAVNLRPHVKTHKCPTIAHIQKKIAGNTSQGICVATVGEAEIFSKCGFDDILIANEIFNVHQIKRLIDLNKWTKVMVCVDSEINVKTLNEIAAKNAVILEVLIDLDVGMGRQGIKPEDPALNLAKVIKECSNLELVGLQAYEGHLTPMMDAEQRKEQTENCMQMAVKTRDIINSEGFQIGYITASGSGTYNFSAKVDGITEIQPGTYVFSDEHLHRISPEFEIATTVVGTIQSQTGKREFTLDAGSKAVPTGDGKPEFKDYPKNRIRIITEEHTQFKSSGKYELELGKKLELIPAHICTTCNLYDFYNVKKDNKIIARWDIMARGKNY